MHFQKNVRPASTATETGTFRLMAVAGQCFSDLYHFTRKEDSFMEHLDFIKVDIVEEGIAVVTLNRPPVNAFNLQMYRELHKAVQFTDDPANNVRCVVVCAEGKMFSPGNDVNDFADDSTYQVANYSDVVAEGLDSVMLSKVPVVVAVNGACAGAGFCIPAVADVVVATEKAKFGITELNVGIIGGAAEASYCLPPKVVSYMSLTGRMMSARDMEKYSFVHKIVPEEQLMDEAMDIARAIAAHPPIGLRYSKEVLLKIFEPDVLAEKVEFAAEKNRAHKKTADFKEAVSAFLEKRKPRFQGK